MASLAQMEALALGWKPRLFRDASGKVCGNCKTYLEYSKFHRQGATARDGYQNNCKECNHKRRKFRLVSEDDFNRLESQGCAICGTLEWPGHHGSAHIDHDHKTGEFRGILCMECNTGIGKFKDSPDLLRRAIEYLATKEKK